jgi:hypothetical protein
MTMLCGVYNGQKHMTPVATRARMELLAIEIYCSKLPALLEK